MNNKEPIIIGNLKKEKSSKPLLAFIILFLVLGACFGLPYIKSYLGEDYDLMYLLGGNTNNQNESVPLTTTTTTTTTTSKKEEKISCKKDNDSYTYTYVNLKLNKINHHFDYQNNDQILDQEVLTKYNDIVNKLNTLGINGKVTEKEDGFSFETIIDKSGNYTEINENYYSFNLTKEDLINNMTGKGFDCK